MDMAFSSIQIVPGFASCRAQSSIVDKSIDEIETVTEEKTVTVEKLPTITSTFEFSEQ